MLRWRWVVAALYPRPPTVHSPCRTMPLPYDRHRPSGPGVCAFGKPAACRYPAHSCLLCGGDLTQRMDAGAIHLSDRTEADGVANRFHVTGGSETILL